ncbi:MAG: cysteine desulfurase family protein [Candidatus Peregrinibacteria bacterium]|nr:cysteine desulfurase family protein [Candidatus Peregrinibacteria bacterium]
MINNSLEIYLDHAATTAVDPQVLEAMLPYFSEEYGNAESLHTKGQNARMAVDKARETVAKALHCQATEIIFTSGGTESNNLAILGVAHANEKKGKHLIASAIEHSSARSPFNKLAEEGFEITWLKVDKEGFVNPTDVAASIRPDTTFVSVMYANNEIGTVEPIAEIGKICREKGVIFHTDACQAADSQSLDVEKLQVDMITINASKIYGPKGAGALYVKQGTPLSPQILGSSHEQGFRAGTHNVPGIVGLGKALELATKDQSEKIAKLTALRNKFIKGILEKIPNSSLNGPNPFDAKYSNTICPRLPNNTNFTFKGVEGPDLVLQLDNLGIYISTGAACNIKGSKPSNVLLSIGLPKELIQNSVRMTLGKMTTDEEINHVLEVLPPLIAKMRNRY